MTSSAKLQDIGPLRLTRVEDRESGKRRIRRSREIEKAENEIGGEKTE